MLNKLLLTHDDQFGMTSSLKKPDTDISNMLETPKHNHKPLLKAAAIIFAIITAFVVGLHFGRSYTIRQAELLETTNDTYYIGFGDEVHQYTFEEMR